MMRILKGLLLLAVLLVFGAAALFIVILDDEPRVAAVGAPAPEDVARTQRFVRQVRDAVSERASDPADRVVMISEEQANSVAKVVGRLVRGLRGEVRVEDRRVFVTASMPVPWPGGARWLNASAVAPEFTDAPMLERLEVGGMNLPPAPVIEVGRIGANLILGNSAGDILLDSASGLVVEGEEMRIALRLDETGKSDFAQGVFGALRGTEMPAVERIDAYYFDLREAMEAGRLPPEGSYLPYLRHSLERVLAESTDETLANEYTAAIFALTMVCGANGFELVVGPFAGAPDAGEGWEVDCDKVLFSGRDDTRRHFTTAAAIQAASNRGFSVAVGELKELIDSVPTSRKGFDFTDITANNSGIRLSNRVMEGTREDLRRTLGLIESESDVLADLSQVPPLMRRTEFEERFGSIASPRYTAMLTRIEELIDEVTIHRPRK